MTTHPGDHTHRCREGHTWHHAMAPGRACSLREYEDRHGGRHVSPEDCPRCADRGDLIERGRHEHRCPACGGAWAHEVRCAEEPDAQCPWCFARDRLAPAGMRLGPHRHDCPRCLEPWTHQTPCAEPLRVVLRECPTCGDALRPVAEPWQVTQPRRVGRSRGRSRASTPRGSGRAVLVTGAALGALALAIGVVWWLRPVPPRTDLAAPPGPASRSLTMAPPAPAQPAPTPSPPVLSTLPKPPDAAPLPPAAASPTAASPSGAPRAAPPPFASDPARPPTVTPSRPIPSAGTAAAATSRAPVPLEQCTRPAAPALVISAATGETLGLWIDVELDRSGPVPRCLFVIERAKDTRWVIDAGRVSPAPPGSPR